MQTIEILTYKINYKSSRSVKNDIRVFKMFKSFYKWFCYCMYDWLKILICLLFYSFLSRIHVIIWNLNFKNAEMFLFIPFKLIHTYSLLHCAFHKCRTGIYVDYVVALSGWRFFNCSTTPLECWHKIRIPSFGLFFS